MGLAGCAFGFRAMVEFDGSAGLDGVGTVILDLPDTDVTVNPTGTEAVTWRGRWTSFGGSEKEAEKAAESPRLVFDTDTGNYAGNRVVRLTEDIPLVLDGLVELELESVELPRTVALEIRVPRGDVSVRRSGAIGVSDIAPAIIEVDEGDVSVTVAADVTVRSGVGAVDVEAGGSVRILNRRGAVYLRHGGIVAEGGSTPTPEIEIVSRRGDVDVHLADDDYAGMRFDLEGREIRVDTPMATTVASGAWSSVVGDGSLRVTVRARGGDVLIRTDDPMP